MRFEIERLIIAATTLVRFRVQSFVNFSCLKYANDAIFQHNRKKHAVSNTTERSMRFQTQQKETCDLIEQKDATLNDPLVEMML